MNEIESIRCPDCGASEDSVEKMRSHISLKHCLFCGSTAVSHNVAIREDVSRGRLNRILASVRGKREDNLSTYTGGFTHSTTRQLLESAEQLVSDEGPLTSREALEYHELHDKSKKGATCDECFNQYSEILREV